MSNMSIYVLFSLLIVGIFSLTINNNVISSEKRPSYRMLHRQKNGLPTDLVTSVFILMKCLPTESHLTLLLGGDYNEFLVESHKNMIPVILIDETNPPFDASRKFALSKYSDSTFENNNFMHFPRAHRFVLVTSSQPLLRALLQKTKDSPYANPKGFYILVDKQTETRGCINARSYLWTAWEYDLLSVIFVCMDPDDGIVLYTFNPYSNSKPDSWYEVEHVKGRAGHPWIILKRKFIHDSNICIDLDFDKTTTLNGYQIRLNAIDLEPFVKINLSLPKEERLRGECSDIIKMLLNKLNASSEITIHHWDVSLLRRIQSNSTYQGYIRVSSRVDITMNTRYIFKWNWSKIKYLYPHMKDICAITQSKKQISEFTKIIRFLSPEIIVGIIGICLLTYIVFVKYVGYIKAVLEVIRLVVSVGFLYVPKMNSARIFICMVWILILIINALFQSHLSSLLTVPAYYYHIDSIESLEDAGYTLYGLKNFHNLTVTDPVTDLNFMITKYIDCIEYVENSSTAACLNDCTYLYHTNNDKDLIITKMRHQLLRSYVTRENWPLYNRVNDILLRMTQAGLIKKVEDEIFWKIKYEEERRNALTKNKFKIISLKQLTFSFYILGFGYICAIIVFVLELAIGGSIPVCQNRKVVVKKRKKNTRKKGESKTDSKLSILTLKTNLKFKRKLKIKRLSERKAYLKEQTVHI